MTKSSLKQSKASAKRPTETLAAVAATPKLTKADVKAVLNGKKSVTLKTNGKAVEVKSVKFSIAKGASLDRLRPGSARFEIASTLLSDGPKTREQLAELVGKDTSQAIRVLTLQKIIASAS